MTAFLIFFISYFKLKDSECKPMRTALEKVKRPLYEKHPGVDFSFTITEDSDTVSISYLSHGFENDDGDPWWIILCSILYQNLPFTSNGKCGSVFKEKTCFCFKGEGIAY